MPNMNFGEPPEYWDSGFVEETEGSIEKVVDKSNESMFEGSMTSEAKERERVSSMRKYKKLQ